MFVPPSEPSFRVLCIDDEILYRIELQKSFETYGFEVVTAANGVDAMMQYRAHQGEFAAIVAAFDAARSNGLELVKSFREMGYSGQIVVVAENLRKKEFLRFESVGVSGFFRRSLDGSLLAAMLLKERSRQD